MTTAVIVQARMGSTRLPGKVMLDLDGKTVLQHVLERCRAVPGADMVVCAIADEPGNQPLADVAQRAGALVHFGSASDVLSRYLGAARACGADIVMRVTSDCPLIDPATCGAVLALRAGRGADYAANNMPRGFPHGLDCEAFTTAALAQSAAATDDPHDREHVTPWLRRAPGLVRANLDGPGGAFAGMRWTLDYPEDYAFFRALFPLLRAGDGIPPAARVAEILQHHPEIAALNEGRRQPQPQGQP